MYAIDAWSGGFGESNKGFSYYWKGLFDFELGKIVKQRIVFDLNIQSWIKFV